MTLVRQAEKRLAEKFLQLKSGSMSALHRQVLRQRVNRCWDLLQQQQKQQQADSEGRIKAGRRE